MSSASFTSIGNSILSLLFYTRQWRQLPFCTIAILLAITNNAQAYRWTADSQQSTSSRSVEEQDLLSNKIFSNNHFADYRQQKFPLLSSTESIGQQEQNGIPPKEYRFFEHNGIRHVMDKIDKQISYKSDSLPSLPQDDSKQMQDKRRRQVMDRQAKYKYNYNTNLEESPLLAGPIIPKEEIPTPSYLATVGNTMLNLFGEKVFAQVRELIKSGDPMKLMDFFKMMRTKTYDIRPKSVDDYNNVFVTPPPQALDYKMDAAFARYRLSGACPTAIRRCTKDILETKMNFDSLPQKMQVRVQKALKEGRLFVTDYTQYAMMRNGFNGRYEKFQVSPIALFEMPEDKEKRDREWLEPLAIQCAQIHATPKPEMITAEDGDMMWTIAKAVLNSADGYQQQVEHLGHQHLVIEAFIMATRRQLPTNHPIHVLFKPHFIGTVAANFVGVASQFGPGGPFEQMDASNVLDAERFTASRALEKMSRNLTFPDLIRQRGMTKEEFPAEYPYRDDGMLYWDAIREWVDGYLSIYYCAMKTEPEKRIREDYELQAWIRELQSWDNGARVRWLHSWDGSYTMLVDIIASVMHMTTAAHAAVNFSPMKWASYVPAYPLALYKAPPRRSDSPTMQDYLDMLPPLEMAEVQRRMANLLGETRYNMAIGDYSDGFKEQRVQAPLEKFRRDIDEIRRTIKERNRKRVAAWRGLVSDEIAQNWAYEYMLPENIPQSINI